jgi:hypothetical protein
MKREIQARIVAEFQGTAFLAAAHFHRRSPLQSIPFLLTSDHHDENFYKIM